MPVSGEGGRCVGRRSRDAAPVVLCPTVTGTRGSRVGLGARSSSAPRLWEPTESLTVLQNSAIAAIPLPSPRKQTNRKPWGISLQGRKNELVKCIFSLKLGAGVGRCDLILPEPGPRSRSVPRPGSAPSSPRGSRQLGARVRTWGRLPLGNAGARGLQPPAAGGIGAEQELRLLLRCFSFPFFFLLFWLKRQLLDLVTAERQQKMLLNPPRASFSREEAAALPGVFGSRVLGCCCSGSAGGRPRVDRRRRGWPKPWMAPSRDTRSIRGYVAGGPFGLCPPAFGGIPSPRSPARPLACLEGAGGRRNAWVAPGSCICAWLCPRRWGREERSRDHPSKALAAASSSSSSSFFSSRSAVTDSLSDAEPRPRASLGGCDVRAMLWCCEVQKTRAGHGFPQGLRGPTETPAPWDPKLGS